MKYLGAKTQIAKRVASVIAHHRSPGQDFYEPFCGALCITQHVPDNRFCSDNNYALITMYKALQKGWEPPTKVSEAEYYNCKAKDDQDDPLTAFIAIGCSFGGKWWGGYARDGKGKRNYALEAYTYLLDKFQYCHGVKFRWSDFWHIRPTGALIYCDPPYAGTTGYGTQKWNPEAFWKWAREVSQNNTVLISEYTAPTDFECIWAEAVTADMPSKDIRIEKVFKVKR